MSDMPHDWGRLSSKAASELGFRLLLDDQGRTVAYVAEYRNPHDRTYEGQKIRYRDGRRQVRGTIGKYFFGQHAFRQRSKTLYVTEGEKDAVAARTALYDWPVVSLPTGAQSAKGVFEAQLDWLSQFDEIILCFDSDIEGQKAAKAVASILPPGKCRVVSEYGEGCKDSYEALNKNGAKHLRNMFFRAPAFSPLEIVHGKELWNMMFQEIPQGHDFMFPGLTKMCRGRSPHQIQLIGGPTGAGKTTVAFGQIAWDLAQGLRVGVLPLEEGPQEAGRRALQELTQVPFFLNDQSLGEEQATPYLKDFERLMEEQLFIVNHRGSIKPNEMDTAITWLAAAQKCDVIYVDHLTLAVSDSDASNQKMDALMSRLISLVQQHPIHLTALCQMRKGGKSWEFGAPITQADFRGSSSITDSAFYAWGVERNQTTEEAGKVRLVKRRKGVGPIGVSDGYMIDQETGCVRACDIPEWDYEWEGKERSW
jgi:twinkle protein